jgi:predicted DNA-binding protein YlxM (UPF0122 family)
MKKIIKLTESDLTKLIKKVINESETITKSMIDKVKDRLTPNQVKLLTMRYVDNMSPSEIGDKLGFSAVSVRQKLKTTENQLKRLSYIMDKNPDMTDNQKKSIKIEMFDSELRTLIEKYSKSLSKEEINKVIKKII